MDKNEKIEKDLYDSVDLFRDVSFTILAVWMLCIFNTSRVLVAVAVLVGVVGVMGSVLRYMLRNVEVK